MKSCCILILCLNLEMLNQLSYFYELVRRACSKKQPFLQCNTTQMFNNSLRLAIKDTKPWQWCVARSDWVHEIGLIYKIHKKSLIILSVKLLFGLLFTTLLTQTCDCKNEWRWIEWICAKNASHYYIILSNTNYI